MDFFSKLAKTVPSPAPTAGGDEPSHPQGSGFDILNSAKVVAGAAQSHFSNQPATYDNVEVAGATADLLGAASEYGKLDKTQGVGQYVDQAETYLHDYKTSHTAAVPTPAATTDKAAEASDEPVETKPQAEETTETRTESEIPSDGGSAVETDYKSDVLPTKITGEDSAIDPDASDKPEEDKTDALIPSKIAGEDTATEPDASDKPKEEKTDVPIPSKIAGEETEIQPDSTDTYGEEEKGDTILPSKTGADDTIPEPDVGSKTEGKIDEGTEEVAFSAKPIGEETAIKADLSNETDTVGDGKPGFNIEEEKFSFGIGGVKEAEAEEEVTSDEKPSSGNAAAAVSTFSAPEGAEDFPQKPSFAFVGDTIGEKINESAGGFGSFTKVVGKF